MNSIDRFMIFDVAPVFIIMGILACGVIIMAAVFLLLVIIIVVSLIRRSRKKSSVGSRHGGIPGVKPNETGKYYTSKERSPVKKELKPEEKHSNGPFICLGAVAVIVVIFLVLSAFTGAIVFFAVKLSKDDPGSISIESFGPPIVDPLSLLTIKGSGFDPENSAISVVLINEFDIPLTFPATYADDGCVEVVVPPYSGRNGSSGGKFDVKIVQISDERVITSNVLEGLEIGPMLALNSSIEPGVYTGLYLSVCMESLNAMILNSTDGDLTQALLDNKGRLMDIKTQLDQDIADGSQWLNLSQDQVNLGEIDRFLLNMVHQTVDAFPEEITRTERTRADVPHTPEEQLKDLDKIREITKTMAGESGELLAAGLKLSFGMFMTVACLAGGAGLGMSLTAGVAFAIGTSWLIQMASGESPTPMGSLETTLETLIDEYIGNPAISILKQQLDFFKICYEKQDNWNRLRNGEPKGGVVLTDWKKMNPPFLEDIRLLYKKAPGAHTQRLILPQDRPSIPFKDAIPPIPPGRIVYSGNFDGWGHFRRTSTCPQCGSVVSDINYYVVGTITFTANVDEKGKMTGTMKVSGSWEASGIGGCPHIAVQSSSGPLNSEQSVSGSTSGFSAGSGAGEMVSGIKATMDPDSVYGEMSFLTTDGTFSVSYVLTVDD